MRNVFCSIVFVVFGVFFLTSCSEEYKQCKKECRELSNQKTEMVSIVNVRKYTYNTVVIMSTGKSCYPVTQVHNRSEVTFADGHKETYGYRVSWENGEKVLKVPVYRPKKDKQTGLYHPEFCNRYSYEK